LTGRRLGRKISSGRVTPPSPGYRPPSFFLVGWRLSLLPRNSKLANIRIGRCSSSPLRGRYDGPLLLFSSSPMEDFFPPLLKVYPSLDIVFSSDIPASFGQAVALFSLTRKQVPLFSVTGDLPELELSIFRNGEEKLPYLNGSSGGKNLSGNKIRSCFPPH